MTLEYSLDENDYLQYQLFIASQSPLIKRKRLKGRTIVPVMYIVFGIFLLSKALTIGAIAFFLFAIVWFLFYPLWDKRVYEKHYRKWLAENYKYRYNRSAIMEIEETYVQERDGENDSKISSAEISSVDEIPGAIYIRLKAGISVIIPAGQITEELRTGLKNLSVIWKVPYTENQQWKWK